MSNRIVAVRDTHSTTAQQRISSADPLIVELDGGLVRGNLLLESIIRWLKRPSFAMFLLPLWALRGRNTLAREVARHVEPECASLALDQSVLARLKAERAGGRRLYLVSDAPKSWSNKIAGELGLFDGVLDSGVPGWSARTGERRLEDESATEKPARGGLSTYLRAMRVHQWLKNALLFVPLIASQHFTNPSALLHLAIAFVAFGLCASSVYLLNDLADLEDDRRHPTKRRRPLASGELPLSHGLFLVPVLLVASAALTLTLPSAFAGTLAIYYVMTLAYTFVLKRLEAIDVVTLALLYTTRIVAGGAVTGTPLSVWLLTFSTFIFLSLALAKRCAELFQLRRSGGVATSGRGYFVDDLPILFGMGIGASYVGALVLALYLVSPQVSLAYAEPHLLWVFVPAVIYWATRLWLKTGRGEMNEDPLVFTARDPVSLIVVAVGAAAIWLAM
jgi:4-hydroxybenzoate polyprenyltransferase